MADGHCGYPNPLLAFGKKVTAAPLLLTSNGQVVRTIYHGVSTHVVEISVDVIPLWAHDSVQHTSHKFTHGKEQSMSVSL